MHNAGTPVSRDSPYCSVRKLILSEQHRCRGIAERIRVPLKEQYAMGNQTHPSTQSPGRQTPGQQNPGQRTPPGDDKPGQQNQPGQQKPGQKSTGKADNH